MSDEIRIQITGDTKPFDTQLEQSLKTAEQTVKIRLEKPLDSALSKSKAGIKKNIQDPIANAGKEAEDSFGKKFSNAFTSGLALPNIASAVFLAQTAIKGLTFAGENFFNVFRGEKLLKIEKNFANMAASFGVAGDMAKAFESRGGGLFAGEDMVQSLTEKLITFEGKIEKMPDLFTAARRAANLFGGDAMDMFEKLSFAAQTGNTRSLRFMFPKLDLQSDVDKYAIAQNKLVSELSNTEIQQIRLNKILDEANKRLQGVSAESTSAAAGWKRLKNAMGDVADDASKATSKGIGGFFSTFTNGMADIIKGGPKAVSEIKSISEAMENQAMATRTIAMLEKDLAAYRKTQAGRIRGDDPYTVKRLNGLKALSKAYDEYIEKQKRVDLATGASGEQYGPSKPSAGYANAIAEINNQIRNKQQQTQTQLIASQYESAKTLENLNLLSAAKEKQLASQSRDEKLAILRDYQSKSIISEEQFTNYRAQLMAKGVTDNQAINNSLAINQQATNARKLEIDRWYEAEKKKLQEDAQFEEIARQMSFQDGFLSGVEGFYDMILKRSQELQKNYSKTMASIADSAINGLGNGIGNGIKRMTIAFRDGQNGLEAFGEAFLATIGDMMVQMGMSFMTMAVPMMIVSDPRGGPLMAAGAGLIVAGTLLSASVSGSSGVGSSTTGTDTSSGVTSVGSTNNPRAIRPDDLAEVRQQPKIEVNFSGNLLNNKESALYIAEVLQDAAFSNDIKFGMA